jgi:hypothetical protein
MTNCEFCLNYVWDEDYGERVCCVPLDEDEMGDCLFGRTRDCPFFQLDDEYKIVQKQN